MFQTNRSNELSVIHPSGRSLLLPVYRISGYTNLYDQIISNQVFTSNNARWVRRILSNNQVEFSATLASPLGNGLSLNPTSGLITGTPATNFLYSNSVGGLVLRSTNRSFTVTRLFSNGALFSTLTSPVSTTVFTSPVVSPTLRIAFPSNAPAVLAPTEFPVGTNGLPQTLTTNGFVFSNSYQIIGGGARITNGTNLVFSNAGSAVLRLVVRPSTNEPDRSIWSPVTQDFFVRATNPVPAGFAFITNTSLPAFTRTNLGYDQITPLVLLNPGSNPLAFAALPPTQGVFFLSNGTNFFRARGASSNVTVRAIRPASSGQASATATVVVHLAPATNSINMFGVFSNTNQITVTNPAFTNLTLWATASSGADVLFRTNGTLKTNGNTLFLGTNLTAAIEVVAFSSTNYNTNHFLPAAEITNTVNVAWDPPGPPFLLFSRRQDARQGDPYRLDLRAFAVNTNAFPVGYGASQISPGLALINTSQLSGTNTNAGFYLMRLFATNAGGTSAQTVTAAIAAHPVPGQADPWFFRVSIGTGTNTNGTYNFPGLPPGIHVLTNGAGDLLPGSVTLTNSNSTFAGITNLLVVFSNAVVTNTQNFSLHIRPAAPVVAYNTNVTNMGRTGVRLSVRPTNLAGHQIPGYPLVFLSSNSLPSGLFLNPQNGEVSGIPRQAGIFSNILVWATNPLASNSSTTNRLAFVIEAFSEPPVVVAGGNYRGNIAGLFTNTNTANVTYTSTNLPPGLTLVPSTGLVVGYPRVLGSFPFTVVKSVPELGTHFTNTTNLTVLPPVPRISFGQSLTVAIRSNFFVLQPAVVGVGWEWAGTDPLVPPGFLADPSQINLRNFSLFRTNPISQFSNAVSQLVITNAGLVYSNSTTNTNQLQLWWRSPLPSSTPWTAMVRAQVSTNAFVLGSTQAVIPFLEAFLAPSNTAIASSLDVVASNQQSIQALYVTNTTTTTASTNVAGQLLTLRFDYRTNEGLVFLVNTNATNLADTNFVPLLTNNLQGTNWAITNRVSALQLAIGVYSSNAPVTNPAVSNGAVRLRDFSLLPAQVAFSAANLPPGLVIDPTLGTIYGTPTTVGEWQATVTATNAQGASRAVLRLRVQP